MADSSQKDIAKLSADKLMVRFGKSGILACLFVAFALHMVVLGATSVDYLHGLVDPAWREQQDSIREEAKKAKAAKNAPAPKVTTEPTTKPAGKASKDKPKPTTTAGDQRKLPPELTTMPTPGEIPSVPGTGIGIDETESTK
jgi:hypothetical protein